MPNITLKFIKLLLGSRKYTRRFFYGPIEECIFSASIKETYHLTGISRLSSNIKIKERMEDMIILGIDPGTAIMGYGLIEKLGHKIRPLTYSCWRTAAHTPQPERLLKLYEEMCRFIEEHRPDQLAVEELFFNRNTTTALTVGQARGVVLLAAAQQRIPVFEYTPLQVKQAVVGYGKAEKIQVQQMVRALLGLKEIPKPDDAADALAIAICHAHSNRIQAEGTRT